MQLSAGMQYAGALIAGAAVGTGTVLAFGSLDRGREAKHDAKLDALSPSEYKSRSQAGKLPGDPVPIGFLVGAGIGTVAVGGGLVLGSGAVLTNLIGAFSAGSSMASLRPAGLGIAGGAAAIAAAGAAYVFSQRS